MPQRRFSRDILSSRIYQFAEWWRRPASAKNILQRPRQISQPALTAGISLNFSMAKTASNNWDASQTNQDRIQSSNVENPCTILITAVNPILTACPATQPKNPACAFGASKIKIPPLMVMASKRGKIILLWREKKVM